MSAVVQAQPPLDFLRASARLPKVTFALFVLAIVFVFSLSGDLLVLLNISYVTEGGNLLHKIHPSIYVLTLGLAYWVAFYRNGWAMLLQASLHSSCFYLLLCSICLMVYVTLFSMPLANPFVTFFGAYLFYTVMILLTPDQRAVVTRVVLIMLLLNSGIGIYEYLQGATLVPATQLDFMTGEYIDASEWTFIRSYGLLGHPLTSTLLTALFLTIYLVKFLFERVSRLENCVALLAVIALPLFGGRAAIAVFVLIALMALFFKLLVTVRSGRVERVVLIALALALLALPAAAFFAFQSGLLDPVLERIEDDQGSAETRMIALKMLLDTPFTNLLLGNFDGSLKDRQMMYGTHYGIEVSWIALILMYGAINTALIIYSLYGLSRAAARRFGAHALLPAVFFFVAISSGTGLASKSLYLVSFIVMIQALMTTREAQAAPD